MNPEKKLDFKKTLEEIAKLAERKLPVKPPKPRKHEGPGREKIRRLTAEETASELEKGQKEGGGN